MNVFIALAPVARLENTLSPLFKNMAKYVEPMTFFLTNVLHMYDLLAPNWESQYKSAMFCSQYLQVCEDMLKLYADLDPTVDNWDRVKTFKTHTPSGACYKNFAHYAQFINSKQF